MVIYSIIGSEKICFSPSLGHQGISISHLIPGSVSVISSDTTRWLIKQHDPIKQALLCVP